MVRRKKKKKDYKLHDMLQGDIQIIQGRIRDGLCDDFLNVFDFFIILPMTKGSISPPLEARWAL